MLNADDGMTFAGVGLAIAAAAFAYVSVERNDGVPGISGQEHLALFAKPSRSGDDRSDPTVARPLARAEAPAAAAAIDYSPTAAIRESRAPPTRIKRTSIDRVVVEGPDGLREIRRGEVAKGLGKLQAIHLVEGRWTATFIPESDRDHSSR